MRSLTRLGVTAAAAILASAAALNGAGVAGAQGPFDTGSVAGDNFAVTSPSTLTSARTAQGVTVAYKNKTKSSLACVGMSAPAAVVGVVDAHVRNYREQSLTEAALLELEPKFAELQADADISGRMFQLNGDGSVSGEGITLSPGSGSELIEPGEVATWAVPAPSGYSAEALLVCVERNLTPASPAEIYAYVEYVSTTNSGGGVFGSLDFFGSLGPLGS